MIIRTFACNDCDALFEVTGGMNDPDPECPACNMVMDWRPTSFNIGGSTEGKAVKVAQEILETEYGLTNYKDNNRGRRRGLYRPAAENHRGTGEHRPARGRRPAARSSSACRTTSPPNRRRQADDFFAGPVPDCRSGSEPQVPAQNR